MRLTYFFTIFLGFSILLGACGDDKKNEEEPTDSEAPAMTITKPAEGSVWIHTSPVLLSGTFTDDMELDQLVVSLSYANKGISDEDEPWAPEDDTIQLSGKESQLTDEYLFGEDVPNFCKEGTYTLTLTLSDASGKETTETININIGQ